MKVAILIIAAKQTPTKKELSTLQKTAFKNINIHDINIGQEMMERWQFERLVWQAYMNIHPQIDCYFVEADETQDVPIKITRNLISIKTTDTYIPGIYIKTCKALEALQGQYDFYIRTNLATFFDFNRLLDCISQLPRHRFYGGARPMRSHKDPIRNNFRRRFLYKLTGGHFTPFFPKPTFVVGWFIVLSKDAASYLASSCDRYCEFNLSDDYVIGIPLEADYGIRGQDLSNIIKILYDLPYHPETVELFVKNNPQACCFRISSHGRHLLAKTLSLSNSKAIASFLLERVYGISLQQ